MDPLSIAASVAGLISLVQTTIPWMQDVWHEPKERRAFEERFRRIELDLFSLHNRLEKIKSQFSDQQLSNGPFGSPQRNDSLFLRAKMMSAPGGDGDILRDKLNTICTDVRRDGRTKLEEIKCRLTWTRKKGFFKEVQKEILSYIRFMRDKLSDDDSHMNYEAFSHILDLKRDKDEKQIIEILEWICPYSLQAPASYAPVAILRSNSFVDSDNIYRQWHQDGTWQLNCYGKPGSGKVSRTSPMTYCSSHLPSRVFELKQRSKTYDRDFVILGSPSSPFSFTIRMHPISPSRQYSAVC